jgi:hypothetical protein
MTATWVFDGLFATLIAFATTQLPRLWRDTEAARRPRPSWWFWGQRTWKAMLRAQPAGICVGWTIALAAAGGSGLNGAQTTPLTILAVVSVSAVVLGAGLIVSIVLFARPKILVPPALRGDQGLFCPTRKRAAKP